MPDEQPPLKDSFTLISAHGGTKLEFRDVIPRGLKGYDGTHFVVSLTSQPLTATVRVYDIAPSDWAALFRDLAANWRGWEGEKSHSSLEGHLQLTCTSDQLGHVMVRAQLNGEPYWEKWKAEMSIFLEAGQFDAIARGSRILWRTFGRMVEAMNSPNEATPDNRPLVIYVDIDDTLVRSVGAKRIPIPVVIRHMRDLAEQGAELYAWSSGGAEYARQSAEELGIAACFVAFLPKPHALLDDQEIGAWRGLVQVHPAACDGLTLDDYCRRREEAGR